MELIAIRQTEEPTRVSEVLEAEQRLAIAVIEFAAREGEYGWLIEQDELFGFWARDVLGLSETACRRLREAASTMETRPARKSGYRPRGNAVKAPFRGVVRREEERGNQRNEPSIFGTQSQAL